MKTALVYPYRKSIFTGCNPPVSLLYLGAALQQAGETVRVLDIDEDDRNPRDLVRLLEAESPDLIGLPLFTLTLSNACQFVKKIREAGIHAKILIGGPHATIRPGEVLEQFEQVDFVIRGEAEDTLVDLVRCLKDGGDPATIGGLSYRSDGRITHNPDRPFRMDLDEIPLPARDMLKSAYDKNTYWRVGHRGTTDVIITSRGCPYNCRFCFRISDKFRTRSPENILEELIDIRSRGIRNVHIMDDLFVWNKPRFFKIVDMIKKEKLNMRFKVRARVNFIDEEMLRAMKEAGVKSVVYGIESGSQTILDAMNKRTTVALNYRAIELTKKAGLQCYADIFLGYPGETMETIRETEQLMLKARPTAVNMAVMYPLPGTEVYNQAREAGTLRNDWNIEGSYAWIKLPWIDSVMDLFKIRKKIMRRYIRHPVVFWNSVKATLFHIDFRQFKVLVNYFLRFKEQ